MGHFRGTIHGNRGPASRLGSKSSGLSAHIASWSGAVDTDLWYDAANDMDMAEVSLTTHHGHGTRKLLYRGPVSGKDEDRLMIEAAELIRGARSLP